VKVVENGKETKSIAATFNDGNQLVKFGNESLTYDANGNRTSDGKYKYTWNEDDQLVSITKQGATTPFATYKYDEDNRRIEKNVNGQVTRYFYDGDSINPLYETDGSGKVLRQYVYSVNGLRMAMKSQGQTLYYHYNPRGDVVAMTDQNREVVATYEYDSWGNVLKSDAKGIAADNPFGYAGYMYDKEIGMYYLIARYYNPEHGVFLSVDPDPGDEDDPITMNGYTYGDNNPVMNVDPDGHWVWIAVNAGFAAYDGYKAYKAGGNWKQVGWAVASNYVKPLKIAKKLGASMWNRPGFRTGTKKAVEQKWGNQCVYCGKKATSIDHIVPWKRLKETFSKNSKVNTREKVINLYNRTINLAPACRSCNSKKRDLPVKKFLKKYDKKFINRKRK